MISISSLVICAWRVRLHDQGQAGDHVAGVAGGVVHSRHLGGVEAGVVFQHRGEQLHADVARQQGLQNGFLVRLVLVDGALQVDGRGAFDLGRHQLLAGRHLADHRAIAAVEQRHHVDLAGLEALQDERGGFLGAGQGRLEPASSAPIERSP